MRLKELQARREEELCAILVAGRSDLAPAVERLRSPARTLGVSLVEALLAQNALTQVELARALRAWREEPPAPVPWNGLLVYGEAGRGTHGVVYLARRETDGAAVALKLLRPARGAPTPSEEERFLREARLLARLDHPGIVRLLGAGRDDGILWHLTEALFGGSLAELGRQPPARALELVAGVARALAHAHAVGIVHRDLKPTNVLLDKSGRPRVVDFGLARDSRSDSSAMLIGTLHWAAPEQLVSAGRVDHKADVWALGAILHGLLVGEPPFAGEKTFGGYYSRARAGFPGLRSVPGAAWLHPATIPLLDGVLSESLRLDPAARPDARSLAEALEFARASLA